MPQIKNPHHLLQSSYLKKLRFNPQLLFTLFAKYFQNLRLILLLVLTIIILGIFSYVNLPRSINPQIKIPIVIISTVLPGAGPQDVESLLTIPLEDSIRSIQGIKTVSSTSRDSVSVIMIEFQSGIDPEKAKTDVNSAVDSVTGLPADSIPPKVVKLDFENQPVWTFNLAAKQNDIGLFKFSQEIKDRLESLPEVDHVEVSGQEEQEIQILIQPQSISTYKINPLQVSQLIKTSLKSLPAGSVRTESSLFSLTIDPQVTTVEDLRGLLINLAGTVVKLSDIAQISQRSKPGQPPSYLMVPGETTPAKAVTLSVFRVSNAKIETTVED